MSEGKPLRDNESISDNYNNGIHKDNERMRHTFTSFPMELSNFKRKFGGELSY